MMNYLYRYRIRILLTVSFGTLVICSLYNMTVEHDDTVFVIPMVEDTVGVSSLPNMTRSAGKLFSSSTISAGCQDINNSNSPEECNWYHEQQRRRETVQHACSDSAQFVNLTEDVLKHILVSDEHKVLYCYVPKVACTNWKRIVLLLNGKYDTKLSVHETFIPSLFNFPSEDVKRRLQNYTKFLIVRKPHERLLSAYNEKFMKWTKYTVSIQKKFAPMIRNYNADFLRKKLNLKAAIVEKQKLMIEEGKPAVSFQEFLRYVGDISNKLEDPAEEHWQEITRLCSPCSIKYNFIGKLETLADDTKYILSHIGADDLSGIMNTKPLSTNSSSDDKVQEAFQQVTEEDLMQFEARFKKDMSMFGYQRPAAIKRLKVEEDDREEGFHDNFQRSRNV